MVDIKPSHSRKGWQSYVPVVLTALVMIMPIAIVTMTNGSKRYIDDTSLPSNIDILLQDHEEKMKSTIEAKVKEWVGSTKGAQEPDELIKQQGEMVTTETLMPDPKFLASMKYKKYEENARSKYDMDLLIREFRDKGVVSFAPTFPEGVIDSAAALTRECLEKCIKNPNPPAECGLMHHERFVDVPSVKDIALNYDILSVLAVLHGYDPYPIQTLNYPKSSGDRTHSDYIHFAAHPVALASAVWVSLMDIDPKAGPVQYYQGSHKEPPYNMQDFGLADRATEPNNINIYQDIMTAAMKEKGYPLEKVVMPKGLAFIWAANMVHEGSKMKNPKLDRLSQVTHYFYRNSNYNWAPALSDVENNGIAYFDESAIDYQWGHMGTVKERKERSKFIVGNCDTFTKNKPDIPNPCERKHRFPKILNSFLQERNDDLINEY